MTKFIPKPGDMLEVWNTSFYKAVNREFIAMTSNGRYMCWSPMKSDSDCWKRARPAKTTKTIELYKWECLTKCLSDGYTLSTTSYVTDDHALSNDYISNNWTKVISSKITREVLR